ncbi:SGT1-domain-containing protein [Xylariaceae sp. FL0594]|nr:SGT1-domain-containing protein [Xylariaceae sp. FL0594]
MNDLIDNKLKPLSPEVEAFPRSLPDNCVEYMLFILDGNLDPRTLLSELKKVRKAALQLCMNIAKGYIWQRDSFQLHVKREAGLVYLHGTTDYGDSVEDEWLIVYLLRRLTTAFPSLWARVFDSDGEFLLVEAANVLPNWLSPEIDSNRVWMHDGKLELIPVPATSGVRRVLSLEEAVAFIKQQSVSLVHSPLIEAEAFYRLEKYPEHIQSSLHYSLLAIPRKLAYILREQPAAIAPAAEAFYLRDPIALRPLVVSSPILRFPPRDLVTVGVKFTKVLFAQVKSQHFEAPPVWSGLLNPGQEKNGTASVEEQKRISRLELGMKVTTGFELLAATAAGKDNRLAREFAVLLSDVEEDGDSILPTDEEIAAWPDIDREDDESWMDINFEDFENELEGRPRKQTREESGFGNATTQADLRKIVSRFEDFLNDETAGYEGAELHDMDHDDSSSEGVGEDEDDSSEDEDRAVSFDEHQFSRMMREMMGLPAEDPQGQASKEPRDDMRENKQRSPGGDEEEQDIEELSAQMEAELRGLGALKLDTKPARATRPILREKSTETEPLAEEESAEEEVDIDYNLAKNLLESFKGQAGMAGPAGNLLGLMGVHLPRDEEEDEDED